jgi:hypothetical protein
VVVKLKTWLAAIASGGSSTSTSVTFEASTVTVQVSPIEKSVSGSSVKLCGPPLCVAVCAPLVAQAMLYQPAAATTGSEKFTVMFVASATSIAPFVGDVELTIGAASPPETWAPSPANVLFAKPSHWIAGSNGSVGLVSPASIPLLRRSVLSIVLVRPEPHSTPGSKPT